MQNDAGEELLAATRHLGFQQHSTSAAEFAQFKFAVRPTATPGRRANTGLFGPGSVSLVAEPIF
jgi:hypothetical protein